MYDELREKIAGEIVLSEQPGRVLRKWRDEFNISQHELAGQLKISPSVISDYESGRRKSPGVGVIRKLVNAMIELDLQRGGKFIGFYSTSPSDAILGIEDFTDGIHASVFMNVIGGENWTRKISPLRMLYGYTIIDSIKAILSFTPQDHTRIYGRSSERALMFAGVKYGRSPMIAIRATSLKPAMVVYIRPENVDELAVKLAELDNVLLVVTELQINVIKEKLEKFARSRGVG
jgi:putative transcriptional regulator